MINYWSLGISQCQVELRLFKYLQKTFIEYLIVSGVFNIIITEYVFRNNRQIH